MKLRFLLAVARATSVYVNVPLARADTSTIKLPGALPDYVFEAEPHTLLAPFDDWRACSTAEM